VPRRALLHARTAHRIDVAPRYDHITSPIRRGGDRHGRDRHALLRSPLKEHLGLPNLDDAQAGNDRVQDRRPRRRPWPRASRSTGVGRPPCRRPGSNFPTGRTIQTLAMTPTPPGRTTTRPGRPPRRPPLLFMSGRNLLDAYQPGRAGLRRAEGHDSPPRCEIASRRSRRVPPGRAAEVLQEPSAT